MPLGSDPPRHLIQVPTDAAFVGTLLSDVARRGQGEALDGEALDGEALDGDLASANRDEPDRAGPEPNEPHAHERHDKGAHDRARTCRSIHPWESTIDPQDKEDRDREREGAKGMVREPGRDISMEQVRPRPGETAARRRNACLLYTSDAADE